MLKKQLVGPHDPASCFLTLMCSGLALIALGERSTVCSPVADHRCLLRRREIPALFVWPVGDGKRFMPQAIARIEQFGEQRAARKQMLFRKFRDREASRRKIRWNAIFGYRCNITILGGSVLFW